MVWKAYTRNYLITVCKLPKAYEHQMPFLHVHTSILASHKLIYSSNCSYNTYRCYQPSISRLSASVTRQRMVQTQYTSERSAACASHIFGTLAKL